MKYSNKTFYFQWLSIGFAITFICMAMGFYVTRFLTKNERRNQEEIWKAKQEGKIIRPMKQRVSVMKSLIKDFNISAEEAFRVVDKAQEAPFPEASYLLDGKNKVLHSHISKSFVKDENLETKEFKLTPDRYYKVSYEKRPLVRGMRRLPDGKPPREFYIIAFLSTGVSIILGIGLSLIILTWYMRRKARIAEEVMNKIKAGELHTRFPINQTDEAGLLMLKFNEMAGEIEGLVKNLKTTEEARTKLLQELAHDLRTPVASMKSIQEILFNQGQHLNPDEKQHLQSLAMREVSYFERLVEDLLFLSGVNDPRYSQHMTQLSLPDIVREEIDVFEVGKISVTLEGNEDVSIKGDPHLLHRLLKNALSNAVRHASASVKVTLKKEAQNIILSVQDDGPGFKEEDFRSFGEKKFSRVLNEGISNHISVGLGSVIMKKIMFLHNGTLEIQNTDTGANVTFRFPL